MDVCSSRVHNTASASGKWKWRHYRFGYSASGNDLGCYVIGAPLRSKFRFDAQSIRSITPPPAIPTAHPSFRR